MFRFYDPRVLFAFVLSLSAAEARAFMGSSTDVFGYHEEKLAVASMTKTCADVKPAAIGVTGFAVTPVQLAAADDVAFEAHKEKLVKYFRAVWPEESAWLETDEDLRREVDQAEKDALKLIDGEGELMLGDISNMAFVRVLRPDIIQDPWYWEQAKSERWQSRTGVLYTYILISFYSLEEREYFLFQISRLDYEGFGSLDSYTGTVFPDLIMRERKQ